MGKRLWLSVPRQLVNSHPACTDSPHRSHIVPSELLLTFSGRQTDRQLVNSQPAQIHQFTTYWPKRFWTPSFNGAIKLIFTIFISRNIWSVKIILTFSWLHSSWMILISLTFTLASFSGWRPKKCHPVWKKEVKKRTFFVQLSWFEWRFWGGLYVIKCIFEDRKKHFIYVI